MNDVKDAKNQLKAQLTREFWEFFAVELSFFFLTIFFAVIGLFLGATFTLGMFCILAVIYPVSWVYLVLKHYLNKGYIVVAYEEKERYDETADTWVRQGKIVAKCRTKSSVKRFIRKTYDYGAGFLPDGSIVWEYVAQTGSPFCLYQVEGGLLSKHGLHKVVLYKIHDFLDKDKYTPNSVYGYLVD